MVITGLFLKANEIRMVTLTGNRESHQLILPKTNKLTLTKNPDQAEVAVFVQAVKAHCTDNNVDKIVMNRRATTGQGAGGAGTFLMEGVLLALSLPTIELIHPATIRATDKRENAKKMGRPTTVDMGKAFDYAFEGLG